MDLFEETSEVAQWGYAPYLRGGWVLKFSTSSFLFGSYSCNIGGRHGWVALRRRGNYYEAACELGPRIGPGAKKGFGGLGRGEHTFSEHRG